MAQSSAQRWRLCLARLLAVVVGGVMTANAQVAPTPLDSQRALVSASLAGDLALIRAALDAGANPIREVELEAAHIKLSPLGAAMIGGRVDAARLLLAKGAVFDLSVQSTDFAFFIVQISHDVPMMTVLFDATPPSAAALSLVVEEMAGRCLHPMIVKTMRQTLMSEVRGLAPTDEIDWNELNTPCFAMEENASSLSSAAFLVKRLATMDDAELRQSALDGALLRAANEGDALLAQLFLSAGAAWNGDVEVFQQLLVSAAAVGNTKGVEIALNRSAQPGSPDERGRLALAAACERGLTQTALKLLAAGARPDSTGKGQPLALDSAVRHGDAVMVRALLDAGALVDGPPIDGGWPLREAVYWGRPEIARILIDAGADVHRIDTDGRSALHLSDDYRPDRVPESRAHVEVIRLLASADANLEFADHNGETPFQAALRLRDPQHGIARAFAESGAKLGDADIESVLEARAASLLGWLLSNGMNPNLNLGASSLMERAADYLYQEPGLLLQVLRSPARTPADPEILQSMLASSASENAVDVVIELMRRGVKPAEVSRRMSPVDQALRRGAQDSITVLREYGINLSAQDEDGNTLIHSLLLEDARDRNQRRARRAVIGYYEQLGIAAFLENGFDTTIVNKQRQTIADVAATNPDTRQSLERSVLIARLDASPLFAAVRSRDLAAVEKTVEDGAPLDDQDALGRTPLSLSLALQASDISRYLIRRGAALTWLPARPYLRSDISYVENPDVAGEIRLRLLQSQLLDTHGLADRTAAMTFLERHAQELARPLPDTQWTFSCIKYCTMGRLAGNMSLLGANARRWDEGNTTFFEISRYSPPESAAFGGGSIGGGVAIEFTWTISGELKIPACGTAAESDSTCFPTIVITNLSEAVSDSSDDPIIGIVVTQGAYSQRLMPGMSATLDRSLAPTTVTIEQIKSRTSLMARLSVRRDAGPQLPLGSDFTLPGRMKLYARLGELHADSARILLDPQAPAAAARTNLAAIRVLSARAIKEKFDDKVSDDVKRRAIDIAHLSDLASNIRKSILAIGRLGASDIDFMLAQLDAASPKAPAGDQAQIAALRAALLRAREAAAQSNEAVNSLADEFRTDADTMIADYQGLILEWAQYFSASDMSAATPVDEQTREYLLKRISPAEVSIADTVRSGNGATLRRTFGIPDPAPKVAKP